MTLLSEQKEARNQLNNALDEAIFNFENKTGLSVKKIQIDRTHVKIGNMENDHFLGAKAIVELPEGI